MKRLREEFSSTSPFFSCRRQQSTRQPCMKFFVVIRLVNVSCTAKYAFCAFSVPKNNIILQWPNSNFENTSILFIIFGNFWKNFYNTIYQDCKETQTGKVSYQMWNKKLASIQEKGCLMVQVFYCTFGI